MALTNLNAAPAWTQQQVITALIGRLHMGALLPSAAAVTGMSGWRDGVVASTNQNGSNNIPSDLMIKQAVSPSLNLLCEPGHCVITRSGQGPFLAYLATQGTLTLAAADTVNPRIDLIVAQVYDAALGDGMPTTPALASPGGLVIRAVTGTAAGSPSAPAVPTGSIPLAQVAVAQNATTITNANITDRRKIAFTPSGARPLLPGDAAADAGAVSGELKYSITDPHGGVYVWSGTGWKPVGIPVYTSTAARDAALPTPFVDQLAWTTDQHKLWRYGGSGWDLALGANGKLTPAGDYALNTVDTMRDTLSFNGIVGHEYELRYSGCFSLNTSGNAIFNMRVASGGSVTTAASTVAGPRYVLGNGSIGDFDFAFSWTAPSTSVFTVGISALVGPGLSSGTVYGTTTGPGRQLRFRDYG
jgi:hypothetical protein